MFHLLKHLLAVSWMASGPLFLSLLLALLLLTAISPVHVASATVSPTRLSNPSHCHYNGEGTWSVGVMEGGDWGSTRLPVDHITLPGGREVSCPRNPILGCSDVTDINASFIADPFLFFPNGTEGPWHAFFEVKNMNNDRKLRARRGQIGTAVSHDEGLTWTYQQIVLKTNHHLSYPHVVEHAGQIYMLPQGRSMSLYRCTSFPTQWKLVKQLLPTNIPFQDITTVFFHDRWWAFGLYEGGKQQWAWMLHIYHAVSLKGPWLPTPNNCVTNHSSGSYVCVGGDAVREPHKRGKVGVRPGGRMFVEDGRLYRVAQDSKKMYGDGMHLYEVTSLTVDQPMREEAVMAFENNFRAPHNVEGWNSLRYHHADLHKIPGRGEAKARWVMLVDGDYNRGMSVIPMTFSAERCADVRRNNKGV